MTMFGEYSIFWCQLLYLGIQALQAYNVLKHDGMILKQACIILNFERLGD